MTLLFLLSFDSLEYQEFGLNCNYLSESVEKEPYSAGRYYLGIANSFIKFPRTVTLKQRLFEVCRTKDGLTVHLEVSFQYQLKWSTLGEDYEKTFGHFRQHAFAEVPFFQLRTVHLPDAFEDAIRETQVQEQHIQIARLEQETKKVTFATEVLKAKQAVQKLQNEVTNQSSVSKDSSCVDCRQMERQRLF
eukprot:g17070.t1